MKIFHLPDLGEGLAEAEIREWYVKAGDVVTVDQPLVAMETAKAVVDVPSPYAGKILKLYGNPNDVVQTGAPLIGFEVENDTQHDQGSVVGKLESSQTLWAEEATHTTHHAKTTAITQIMPAARLLAKELNIDLSQVTPSGPNGLITVQDVKNKLSKQKEITAPLLKHGEKLHGARRIMAETMTKSHQSVVPVTIFDDARFETLPKGFDLTVQLITAIVTASHKEPALNAWFDGAHLTRECFSHVNIGLAVDTEEGLFVPVIKNAEQQSPAALRQMIDTYKITVANRTISPEHLKGATFILSNFGMMAGRYATPIVVPPMVAILAIGRLIPSPTPRLPLSLTFDHRAVTGGEASRFLGVLIQTLQHATHLR